MQAGERLAFVVAHADVLIVDGRVGRSHEHEAEQALAGRIVKAVGRKGSKNILQ